MAVIVTVTAGPDRGFASILHAGQHSVGRLGTLTLSDPYLPRIAAQLQVGAAQLRITDVAGANLPTRAVLAWRQRGGRAASCRRKLRLHLGETRLEFTAPKPASLRAKRGAGEVVRLVIAALMLVIVVPLAIIGPPWRWLMVAMPLMMLASTTRSANKRRIAPIAPGAVLAAHLLGARGGSELQLPAVIQHHVTLHAGAAWSLLGARAAGQARWLAGWLALNHDPTALQVTSPWLTTRSATQLGERAPLHVVIVPARRATAPQGNEMVITYGAALPWAGALRAKAFRRLPSASASFTQAVSHLVAQSSGKELCRRVDFADLIAHTSTDIERRWQHGGSWAVPIGKDRRGVFELDLVRAGPHALVAGTSGAGKSEFLTTWLLSLAAHLSPRALQLVLVDFKGGAAFGPLTDLPHTVALLTDLQPQQTTRALTSLGAQLRQREALFAASGVRDIGEYLRANPTATLAHIVVVIDEFAALAADHPDVLAQLVRLAAQGRSLGLHLIAATQRPAGVVDATMRANMGLRICFRVTTTADSHDILGADTAAQLPAIAGRCIIAGETSRTVQAAWCGEVARVRAVVAEICQAWQRVGGGARAERPWAEELPTCVGPAPGAWGLADHPETLDHRDFALPRGPIAIIGGVESGKTVATTRAAQLLAHGGEVVVIGKRPLLGAARGWIDARDAHLSRHFIEHLDADSALGVVIDDAHLWRASVEVAFGPTWFSEAIETLLRSTRQLVVSADASIASARWMHNVPNRLVLGGIDATAQAMIGVPSWAQQSALVPGRGYECGSKRVIQIAHTSVQTHLGGEYAWHSLPQSCALAPRDFALSQPAAKAFTPPLQAVIVCARSSAIAIACAKRLQRAWQLRGEQAPLIAAGDLTGGEVAPIVCCTGAELAAAITGPLAALRQRAATLLVGPQFLPRTLAAGAHLPSWVFAPCPAHRLVGDAIWIGEEPLVLRVPLSAP